MSSLSPRFTRRGALIENRSWFPPPFRKSDRARRGQSLQLWAMLWASNYRYILLFAVSADDGTIQVRFGPTAQILILMRTVMDTVFMFIWADGELSSISAIERRTKSVLSNRFRTCRWGAEVRETHFNGGREGGIVWNSYDFTTLKVTNTVTMNLHHDPKGISYVLLPRQSGALRTYGKGEEFTEFDFWVTRLIPDDPARKLPVRNIDTGYVIAIQNPLPIEGHPVVGTRLPCCIFRAGRISVRSDIRRKTAWRSPVGKASILCRVIFGTRRLF